MKQGNSESDQTPDFVCFRKVVYVQGQRSEFRMFSKKNQIFKKKIGFSRKKSRIYEEKSRDFVSPGMFHNNFFF